MAEAIAGVRFDLTANSAELDAALGRASRSMRTAQQAGERAGTAIAGAFVRLGAVVAGAFAFDRLVAFGSAAIQAAADLGRFAAQAGMTAEQFQRLDFALRDARVPTQELAQGMAVFARNLSDLERNTGPFLQFLRQSAPHLEAQFRGARNSGEAFNILSDAIATLPSRQDRVRLATAAGSEQFGKLADVMSRGSAAMQEQARQAPVLSDAQIRAAEEIRRKWDDVLRAVAFRAQQLGVAIAEGLGVVERVDFSRFQAELASANAAFAVAQQHFQMMRDNGVEHQRVIDAVTAAWTRLTAAWAAVNAQTMPSGALKVDPGAIDAWQLAADRIKAAQGALALFQAQMVISGRAITAETAFMSTSFAGAWDRMRAVMVANSETATAIAAARINLLRQEDAERQRVLGSSISLEENYTRQMNQLSQARQQGLISEMDLIRARSMIQMQSVGVIAGAMAQTFNSLSQAFKDNKALQIAAAIANTAQSITTTLAQYGYTPWGIAAASAAAVAGAVQIATIRSATPGGGGSVPSVGGGVAPDTGPAAPAAPSRSLTVQLTGTVFSSAGVEDLIRLINEEVANGVTLISTTTKGH